MFTTVRLLHGEVLVPAFGNAYDKSHVYETTKFTLTANGVSLEPDVTDWSKIYGDKPWVPWSNARLSQDRSMYVLPDKKILLKSTIRRVGGLTTPTEHLWLHKMFNMPNSQVKNFMNACRGLYGNEKKVMSIAVVGSKAREGSGLWHKLFALYALSRSPDVYIDFYDSAERNSYSVIEMDGRKATCSWIAEFIDPKAVQEYDVVIDDAWIQGASSLGVEIPAGSIKKGSEYVFLHPTETRLFKSGCSSYVAPCNCLLCDQISKCVDSYPEYQTLRMYCTRLGHNTNCSSAFYNQDLHAVSGFMKELLTKPQVEIRTNMMIRGLLSVMEEVPVNVKGALVTTHDGLPEFSYVSRFDSKEIAEFTPEAPHLNGKRVLFIGVPSRVIEHTRILNVVGDSAMHAAPRTDAAFVSNKRTWSQALTTRHRILEIYAPVEPSDAALTFPGWCPTGHRVGKFIGYSFKVEPEELFKVGQYCNGDIHEPMRLLPFLDVSKLGYPLIDGKVDSSSFSYWRIVNRQLVPEKDPTFASLDALLMIDYKGRWQLVHGPDRTSGHLRFGVYSYNYFHSYDKLGGEARSLVDLLLFSQKYSIPKSKYLFLQEQIPQLVIEAKEVRSKKKVRSRAENKVLLTFFFSQKMIPKFAMDVLLSLHHSPAYAALNDSTPDKYESDWSSAIYAFNLDYYDGAKKGKKDGKIQTGKDYGVCLTNE
jgi:hypothetical protein